MFRLETGTGELLMARAALVEPRMRKDRSRQPVRLQVAVIVAPRDERSATLPRGRYLADDARVQIASPLAVVRQLLERVFSIKQMLDASLALVSVAAVLAIVLVFALSLRLREQEIRTVLSWGEPIRCPVDRLWSSRACRSAWTAARTDGRRTNYQWLGTCDDGVFRGGTFFAV